MPWSVLIPHHGLLLPLVFVGIGMGLTSLIGRWLDGTPIVAVIVSVVAWGGLGLVIVWRQGTLRRLFSKRKR